MGRILVSNIFHLSHSSSLGGTRPNRRADISPLRWVLQMKKLQDTQQLGISVYILAMRKEIEKEVESRYTKRIDYLVNANNELMQELEHWENEIITVSKESAIEEQDYEEGGVDNGDGIGYDTGQ